MQLSVNFEKLNNDPAAHALVELLQSASVRLKLEDATIFHNFPLFTDPEDNLGVVNLLVISKLYGIVVAFCSDKSTRKLADKTLDPLIEVLENSYSHVYSRLLKSKLLRKKAAQLDIPVIPILYVPNFSEDEYLPSERWEDLSILVRDAQVYSFFDGHALSEPLSEDTVSEIISLLEGSKALNKPRKRIHASETVLNKAAILEKIEEQIKNFDREQKRAAHHILDGPQRIRGLAGSGKTIVLTMKAALIHLQDPNAEILYTFWTKSLYDSIKGLITRFYRQFAEHDPDWSKIHVLHAWGGKNVSGVYYNTCIANRLEPKTFSTVRGLRQSFDDICKILEEETLKTAFDYALLDEAQDFPSSFYRMCRRITRKNRLIWGYDECQNILNIEIQDTKSTFGMEQNGTPFIDFTDLQPNSLQDLVLHKCYRNPRKVLFTAFALGLGIYNDRIIQLPENNEHWEDLGFLVREGRSRKNDRMVIERPESNSPIVKNRFLDSDDIIRFGVFDELAKETTFVVSGIRRDLSEGLLPEDILVIAMDDRNAKAYLDDIAKKLLRHKISSYNVQTTPFDATGFEVKGSVTLSSVYRAKGNEAASVYMCGVDAVFLVKDSIQQRNKLFTAMTRTNAWLAITGMGAEAAAFVEESKRAISDYPFLKFEQPDRNSLKVFQRDLAAGQANLNKIERELDLLQEKTGMTREEVLGRLNKVSGKKK